VLCCRKSGGKRMHLIRARKTGGRCSLLQLTHRPFARTLPEPSASCWVLRKSSVALSPPSVPAFCPTKPPPNKRESEKINMGAVRPIFRWRLQNGAGGGGGGGTPPLAHRACSMQKYPTYGASQELLIALLSLLSAYSLCSLLCWFKTVPVRSYERC